MARARNIKPSFFINEQLVELPPFTRLLFIGLWTVADREGRLLDRPKTIKMAVFPADDIDVDAALNDLAKAELITRYVVDGKRFIEVINFTKHQSPHVKEVGSTIPAPCLHQTSMEVAALNPESLLLNPESKTDTRASAPKPPKEEKNKEALVIFDYWKEKFSKGSNTQFTKERKVAVTSRLKDSTTAEIKLAIDGCSRSENHNGKNGKTVYDDLELICRTRTKLEQFMGYAVTQPTHANPNYGKTELDPDFFVPKMKFTFELAMMNLMGDAVRDGWVVTEAIYERRKKELLVTYPDWTGQIEDYELSGQHREVFDRVRQNSIS